MIVLFIIHAVLCIAAIVVLVGSSIELYKNKNASADSEGGNKALGGLIFGGIALLATFIELPTAIYFFTAIWA